MTRSRSQIPSHGEVLDIGGSTLSSDIRERLMFTLIQDLASNVKKERETRPCLPDELLYDDKGLAIWADIIFKPEFYQTHEETELFRQNSSEIAGYVPEGAVLIDLGAGDLRKVGHLLEELEKLNKPTTYLALDISQASLSDNINMLKPEHDKVLCAALWGDFNKGLSWVDGLDPCVPRVFLSLGSVLFNDAWSTAVVKLKTWASRMRPQDLILAGMDGHCVTKDADKIWAAYHTYPDLFARFWGNGFAHANRLIGADWLRLRDWDSHGELDTQEGRHRFYFESRHDICLEGTEHTIEKGRVMEWFDSHKHNECEVREMCSQAGLAVIESWALDGSEMRQYLIRKNRGEHITDDIDIAVDGML